MYYQIVYLSIILRLYTNSDSPKSLHRTRYVVATCLKPSLRVYGGPDKQHAR